MNKPAFNPSQPFEAVDEKPPFNPSQPFTAAEHESISSHMANGSVGDVSNLLSGTKRMGMGVVDLPMDTYNSAKRMIGGENFNSTPIGQDYNHIVEAIPHLTYEPENKGQYGRFDPGVRVAPGSLSQQYSDLALNPLKAIPDNLMPDSILTPEQSRALPNPIYDHPVNSALALLPAVKPMFNAARAIPAVDEGLNAVGTGIRQNITAPFARRALGKFPTKTPQLVQQANEAGLNAVDQGIIRNPITHPFSSGPAAMSERAGALSDQVGEEIGKFLKGQKEGLDVNRALSELDDVKNRFPDDPMISRKVDNAKNILARTAQRDASGPSPMLGQKMDFQPANKLKGFFQKKVNYKTDAATQDVGKAIAGQYRDSIDTQLDELAQKIGNKKGAEGFQANKKMFASTSRAEKALDEQVGRNSRNMPLSLPSLGIGMAELLHGGGLKGIATALGAELVKRHGSAVGAALSNNVAQLFLSNPSKYESIVQSAVKSGAATIPAIEQALQADPDYSNVLQMPSGKPKPKPLFRKAS